MLHLKMKLFTHTENLRSVWDLFCLTTPLTGQEDPNFEKDYLDERAAANVPLEQLYFEWTPAEGANSYEIVINEKTLCNIPAMPTPRNKIEPDQNDPRVDIVGTDGRPIGTVYYKPMPEQYLIPPDGIAIPYKYRYVYHLGLKPITRFNKL